MWLCATGHVLLSVVDSVFDHAGEVAGLIRSLWVGVPRGIGVLWESVLTVLIVLMASKVAMPHAAEG